LVKANNALDLTNAFCLEIFQSVIQNGFMPTRFPTQKEIEAKRTALKETIAIGKQAEKDLAKLEETIKTISALVEDDEKGIIIAYELNTGVTRPKRVFSPLAKIAEAVIRACGGPLHINQLMMEMKDRGWVSSGDYNLDMKNVFNSLSVNKKFSNLGKNTWDLTENVKKGEVSK
jgi:hypothetical protein